LKLEGLKTRLELGTPNSELATMLNRPPPYFPQNQLSPPDENRYRRFKLIIACAVVTFLLLLTGLGFGIYYLVTWLF
jgi:hypothetical protein